MKPLSAGYYVKENKGRGAIIIFMMLLTTFIFLAGNYIESVYYYFYKSCDYFDDLCLVEATAGSENIKIFEEVYADLCKDEELIVQVRSPMGFSGKDFECTMGFEMSSDTIVFNTPEDMKTAFGVFGLDCDLSDVKDRSVVMSSALAKQYGYKKGDRIGEIYTLDAVTDDGSYIWFYVYEDDPQPLRLNVLGRNGLSGNELRQHIAKVVNGRSAKISKGTREVTNNELGPFRYIFLAGISILSVVLSIIVNSVITGQYLKRTYEFGVYRAMGISKKDIYRKCGAELLLMNGIAILIGAFTVVLLTFILNELKYIPEGKYLPYYSGIGLTGFLISDLLVLVPTVLFKGRSMARADVTEF
ncbi:MAG: ABC transporter permease [Lachnospiraceae bacterium]|nr:ABC transporter permease [Lachnospiraceae bacterium]